MNKYKTFTLHAEPQDHWHMPQNRDEQIRWIQPSHNRNENKVNCTNGNQHFQITKIHRRVKLACESDVRPSASQRRRAADVGRVGDTYFQTFAEVLKPRITAHLVVAVLVLPTCHKHWLRSTAFMKVSECPPVFWRRNFHLWPLTFWTPVQDIWITCSPCERHEWWLSPRSLPLHGPGCRLVYASLASSGFCSASDVTNSIDFSTGANLSNTAVRLLPASLNNLTKLINLFSKLF